MPKGENLRGKKHPNAGMKKGQQLQVTKETKELFKLLLDGNIDKMQQWLDRAAIEDPAKAFDLMLKLSNKFVPNAPQEVNHKLITPETILEALRQGEKTEL